MAETRNPFKPLGTRLRDFARGKISRYVPAGERSSGKTAAPSWTGNASTPLDWGDQAPAAPQADSVDFSSLETHTERSVPASFLGASSGSQPAAPAIQPQAAADPAPKPKPMSRLDFLNYIWAKREEQLHGNRPAPAETTPAADSANIQRSADGESAQPKQSVGRRRRGAVVDVPSPRSSEPSSESGSSDTPDSPDFFFVGEDSSPTAPLPPSVQAMRAVTPDMPLPSPQQVQRNSAPEEDFAEASSSATSPWSMFTSSSAQEGTDPNIQGGSGAPASAAAQTMSTSAAQSAPNNPTVQRSVDNTSATTSAPASTGETSGILYMPADHVTRSESPAIASPASPSIQRASETSPTQMDVGFQSQPSQVVSNPAQSQPAPFAAVSTSGAAPSIQPSRIEDSAGETSYAQTGTDKPAQSQPAASPSSMSSPSPAPSVQLQRDSQPAPARSQSRKSRAAQPSITSTELSSAADAPLSEPTTAYSPAAPSNPLVQRDMDELAAPPSVPDASTLLTSASGEATPDAPVDTHQTVSPASGIQRSGDPQNANYTDLPDAAFNTVTPSAASSDAQSGPAAPQPTSQDTVFSAQSQPTTSVQRKTSASKTASADSQTPAPATNNQPSIESQHSAPAENAAETPTLLTPTPSIQQSADIPTATTTPAISRYADLPDASFNTPSSAVNTAEAQTQLESPSTPQSAHIGTPAAAAPQRKSNGSIQRRRGSLGVSYTPGENTANAVQRDVNEDEISAAPVPAWTPSAELAPPAPPSFAAPSPWETYMEAPAFDEPAKPAPRSTSGSQTNVDTPAPSSGKAAVQRKAETANTVQPAPQPPISSNSDSSFMSDAPQAASPYSEMPDSSFMSGSAQPASSTYSPPTVNQPNSPATSPSIQRSVQPHADSLEDSSDLPVHDFDIAQAFNSNFIDQPRAHPQTYSAPSSNASPSPSVNVPSISRSLDTGASSSAPSQSFSHNFTPESGVPTPGSVEAGMLQMLNLPPDTPVAGLKPAPAAPEISQMPANEVSSARRSLDASAAAPRFQPSTQSFESAAPSTQQAFSASPVPHETGSTWVQRAESAGSSSTGGSSTESNAGTEDKAQEQDIDGLAREVYKVLRSKLRDEHERRFGR